MSTPLDFDRSDLFEAGQDGYVTFRIPVIACTPQDTLLALCEARKEWGDWADIDLLLRRSTDGGKTWSQPRIVADGGLLPVHNANLLIDTTGVIHLLFFINYEHAYHCSSTDEGQTFSTPREITQTFAPFQTSYLWNVIAGGPGHGITTRSGRLIVPVWLSNGRHRHRPSVVSSIYSDDSGKTWQHGEILPPLLPNMSETVGVELEDGSILFNIRSEDRAHRRAICISPDGASNWSKPVFDTALKEPVCMGNLLRLNFASGTTPGRIVFTNPDNDVYSGKYGESWDNNKDRVNLTIKMSLDDGKTWPVQRVTLFESLSIGLLGLLPFFSLSAQEQSQLDTPQQKAEIKHTNSYRILFIGDSITRHGCNDDTRQRMKWDHVSGMAASSEEKDYAHTFARLVQETQPDRTVEILFHTSGKSGTAAERFATLDKVKPFQPHVVVIQLGEHEQKQTGEAPLRDSYDKLIAAFASQSPKPLILCTGTWNPAAAVPQEGRVRYVGWSSIVDGIFQETCDRYGAAFISVAEIAADPTCKGWGEEKGVQWHPNDKGQAHYAARLFAAYQRLPK